jgi:hypothetical protein
MIQKLPNNNFGICSLFCRYVYAKPRAHIPFGSIP